MWGERNIHMNNKVLTKNDEKEKVKQNCYIDKKKKILSLPCPLSITLYLTACNAS